MSTQKFDSKKPYNVRILLSVPNLNINTMRFAIFKILIALFIALAFGAMIELGFYSNPFPTTPSDAVKY